MQTAKSLIGTKDLTITSNIENLSIISGSAKNPDGTVLSDAKVVFYDKEGEEIASSTSGNDGSFEVAVVAGLNGSLQIIDQLGNKSKLVVFGPGAKSTDEDINIGDIKVTGLATEPTVSENLVYNGQEQQGLTGGSNVTFGGTYKATNAKTGYKATAKPNDGCFWEDGTNDEKTYTWDIAKAEAKISLSATSGQIRATKTGTFTYEYSGDPEATIVAKSLDTSVATVVEKNNTITITANKVGSTSITVSSDETENYTAASSAYNLEVIAAYGNGYALFRSDEDLLTFYNDGKTPSLSPGDKIYQVKDGNDPAWKDENGGIVASKVVFDSTFATHYGLTSLKNWFSETDKNAKLKSIKGLEYVDVSEVKDMSCMFKTSYMLETIEGIDKWTKTDKVEDMSYMFATGLVDSNSDGYPGGHTYDSEKQWMSNLNLSKWDVSNVKDMSYMFCYYNSNLKDALQAYNDSYLPQGLKDWKTSSVINCSYMFAACCQQTKPKEAECLDGETKVAINKLGDYKKISELKIGDTYLGVNNENDIIECVVKEGDIATHNVSTLGTIIFSDDTYIKLTTDHQILTTDGWRSIKSDSASATLSINNKININDTEKSIRSIDVFTVPTVTTYNIRPNDVSIIGYITENCVVENSPSIEYFETWKENSNSSEVITHLDNESSNEDNNPRNFADFPDLTNWQIGNEDHSVDCSYMFWYVGFYRKTPKTWTNVTSIFKNVNNCAKMFAAISGQSEPCTQTPSLVDFSSCNFSKCQDFTEMFAKSGITVIKLPNGMFSSAKHLTSMFLGLSNLTTIYCNYDISVSTEVDSDGMFINDTKLKGGEGTVFDWEHTNHEYAKPDGGEYNPGYFTSY